MPSKISPITLGLLALLAYRTYQGKGRLADMLGGGQPGGAGAQPGAQGGGGLGDLLGGILGGGRPGAQPGAPSGGLGDLLGGLLGGGQTGAPPTRPAPGGSAPHAAPGAQPGGLGDILGGLIGGGAAGSILNGGLGGLLEEFQKNGQGDAARSWIGKGENRSISSDELERAVGKDALDELARSSGRSYQDVVSQLSSELPHSIDHLTPDGRIPTEDEASRWV